MVNLRWAACLIGVMATVLGASACSGTDSQDTPSPSASRSAQRQGAPTTSAGVSIHGYLESTETVVRFLVFTSNVGYIDGQLTTASADSSTGAGVRGDVTAFTARISGSGIGAGVEIDIEAVRWSGKTTASGMTLLIPDSSGKLVSHSFKPASSSDYNAAVGIIGARARLSTAVKDAGAETKDLVKLADFSFVLKSYSDDWRAMQADYQAQQNQRSTVSDNARKCWALAAANLLFIERDERNLASQRSDAERATADAQRTVAKLTSARSELATAPVAYRATQDPQSMTAADSAAAELNEALTTLASHTAAAVVTANQIRQQAQELHDTAAAAAQQAGCH
jgi:hypothetical protein